MFSAINLSGRAGLLPGTTWKSKAALYGLLVLGSVVLAGLLAFGQERIAIALAILSVLVGTALVKPQLAIMLTIGYMTVMGDFRRILIPIFGFSGYDPLLLVGACVGALLAISAAFNRQTRLDTNLARALAVTMAIMVLQIFNPKQGGLAVGVAGALFYIVPLLWYWVGRVFMTPSGLRQLLFGVVLVLGLFAAVFGLYQVYVGWLPYQLTWQSLAGYDALMVSDTVMHPISLFSSAEEYVYFMAVGFILTWAYALYASKISLLLAPIFFWGMVTSGTRTPIVLSLLACAIVWAIQGRQKSAWIPRIALAVVLGVAGLAWSVSEVSTSGAAGDSALVGRQVEGLADPFGENSTGGGHMWLFANGVLNGFRNPLGLGLGATTNAAGKYGGNATTTERDLSNVYVSLGAVGGIAYTLVMWFSVVAALQYWHHKRELIALATIAIMIVMLGQWLDGGLYALSPLMWVCIGALDRFHKEEITDADRDRHE